MLSPTHLHEFKSADKTQSPIMSLYLPEQKLGSRSQVGGSSPKFILKGRQAGGVHRGHSWVFRAESFDTMMAWYEDIKALTEKTPQERNEFVRGHSRSFSRSSQRSISSDGVVDEDDEEPYSAHHSAAALGQANQQDVPRRPSPGGRFPSDLQVNPQRGLHPPLSPSSVSSGFEKPRDNEVIAAAGALPGSNLNQLYPPEQQDPGYGYGGTAHTPMEEAHSRSAQATRAAQQDGVNPYTNQPVYTQQNPVSYGGLPAAVVTSGAAMRKTGADPEAGGRMNRQIPGPSAELSGVPVARDILAPHENDITGPRYTAGGLAAGGLAAHEIHGGRSPGISTRVSTTTLNTEDTFANEPSSSGMASAGNHVSRPTPGDRMDSTPTISNLHIPGQYPKTIVN